MYDELPEGSRLIARRRLGRRWGASSRRKLFTEGAFVKADTPLFEIDPAPFAADVDAATAVLARTEAELLNALGQI